MPPPPVPACASGSSLRSKQAPTGQREPLAKPFSGLEGRSSFQGGVHRAAVEVREGVLRCLHPPWKGDLPHTQRWGPKGCVLPIPPHPVLPVLWAGSVLCAPESLRKSYKVSLQARISPSLVLRTWPTPAPQAAAALKWDVGFSEVRSTSAPNPRPALPSAPHAALGRCPVHTLHRQLAG